jgi:anti-sigma factor RsiW
MLWTRPSRRKFRDDEVRRQLHGLAHDSADFMRPPALPRELERWSLTTPREKLVTIGADQAVGGGRIARS